MAVFHRVRLWRRGKSCPRMYPKCQGSSLRCHHMAKFSSSQGPTVRQCQGLLYLVNMVNFEFIAGEECPRFSGQRRIMNYLASLKLLTYKIGHYFYDAPCGMLTLKYSNRANSNNNYRISQINVHTGCFFNWYPP